MNDSMVILKIIKEIAKKNEFQWSSQVISTIFGSIVIGICIPIVIWLIKKGIESGKKTKEQDYYEKETIKTLTETYVLVKDTRDDVKDIKIDISDIKKTQADHEKRLTGLEKEHKMYSKVLCFNNKDKIKNNLIKKFIRILIVDDMIEVREFMNDYFNIRLQCKEFWNNRYIFKTDIVQSYENAIKKIDTKNYELAIFDYKIDKNNFKNGFDLAKYYKEKQNDSFIIYSANQKLENVPKEFAENFVIKPCYNEDWEKFENKLKEKLNIF